MAPRFAAIGVALVLVFATGAARSISYLCRMDGQLRSACCCKASKAAKQSDQPTVRRGSQCCEVRVSEASQPPAATHDDLQQERLPTLLAWGTLPYSLHVPRPTDRDVRPALGARAPPRAIGPPIFILNCSYLI